MVRTVIAFVYWPIKFVQKEQFKQLRASMKEDSTGQFSASKVSEISFSPNL